MNLNNTVLFSDWFLYNLKEHCAPISLNIMKQVCKYYYSNITQETIHFSIIHHIHKRLNYLLGSKYGPFIKFISINNIAISGPFILQCIYGETWNFNINLYSDLRNLKMDYFYQVMDDVNGVKCSKEGIFEIPVLVECGRDHSVDDYTLIKPPYYEYSPAILKKHENIVKIQMARVNVIMTHKEMINSLKIDICKNIFTVNDNKSNLYVHNLNKILNGVDKNYVLKSSISK